MRPRLLAAAAVTLFTAAAASAALAACNDSSSSSGGAVPDGGQTTPPLPTTPPSDSGAPPIEDAGADAAPVDSGDAGLFGTGKGLRVKFIGNEHSYGGADESSLWDAFKADTTLMPTRVAAPTALDATLLADVDVLVLDSLTRVYTPTEATALYDWVRAGHGVIALSSFTGSNATVNSLLEPFGIAVGSASLGPGNSYCTILPGSPVATGVSSLFIYGGGAVTTANDAGTPYAEYSGNVTGVASTVEKGRVVTYGDDWILLDTEVERTDDAGTKPALRFWHNALLWAGNRL